jgi:hypothetical protein
MNFQNVWLKYGVIAGLALIATSIAMFYLLDLGLFTQAAVIYIVSLIFMVIAGLEFRKNNQDVMLYGEAFKITYLTTLVGFAISSLFSYALITFIDPELIDVLIEKYSGSTRDLMASMGAPEEEINKALEKMEEDMPKQFTGIGMAQSLFTNAVISAILAAIVSIFLRKDEKPV